MRQEAYVGETAAGHGKQLIRTDDDGITVAYFADKPSLDRFVDDMAAAGFTLPEAPPSEMFYWQPWMGPKPPESPS